MTTTETQAPILNLNDMRQVEKAVASENFAAFLAQTASSKTITYAPTDPAIKMTLELLRGERSAQDICEDAAYGGDQTAGSVLNGKTIDQTLNGLVPNQMILQIGGGFCSPALKQVIVRTFCQARGYEFTLDRPEYDFSNPADRTQFFESPLAQAHIAFRTGMNSDGRPNPLVRMLLGQENLGAIVTESLSTKAFNDGDYVTAGDFNQFLGRKLMQLGLNAIEIGQLDFEAQTPLNPHFAEKIARQLCAEMLHPCKPKRVSDSAVYAAVRSAPPYVHA